MNVTQSFVAGYCYGASPGSRELSAREILARYPRADTAAFGEGMLDGLAGDTFRLAAGPAGPVSFDAPLFFP